MDSFAFSGSLVNKLPEPCPDIFEGASFTSLTVQLKAELMAAHYTTPQCLRALFRFKALLKLTDRDFVTLLALFTVSGGKDRFRCSYKCILSLVETVPAEKAAALNAGDERAVEHYNQRIRRRLKSLAARLNRHGEAFKFEFGGAGEKDQNGRRLPTQFRLPLVPLVFRALEDAMGDDDYFQTAQKVVDGKVDALFAKLRCDASDISTVNRAKSIRSMVQNLRALRKLDRDLMALMTGGAPAEELKRRVDVAAFRLQYGNTPPPARPMSGLSPSIDAEILHPSLLTGGEVHSSYPESVHQAFDAIENFAMKGCTVTLLDDVTGTSVECFRYKSAEDFRIELIDLLRVSEEERLSFIVRPDAVTGCKFVQLDDLDMSEVNRIAPLCCTIVETSPGSFQGWMLLATDDKEKVRQLKAAMRADKSASGALRWPGSRNFKPKRRLPDGSFPVVKIAGGERGLVVDEEDLAKAGIRVVGEGAACPAKGLRPRNNSVCSKTQSGASAGTGWPDYRSCLESAGKAAHHSGNDRSLADIKFAWQAASLGHSPQQISMMLMKVSEKARKKGRGYADLTAERGVAHYSAWVENQKAAA